MVKISIRKIQSSSKNSSIVLFDGDTHLFLDFGANKEKINLYLQKYKVNYEKIAGILLSHYHIDHVLSIGNIISFFKTRIYTTRKTSNFLLEKYKWMNKIKDNFINVDENSKKWINIGNTNWIFKTFKTIHNAEGSIAFLIKNKKARKKIIYMTDTEYLENDYLKKCHGYIIESNYGASYLTNSHEKRIHLSKNKNHMNINESINLFHKYLSNKTKIFIFCHLSIKGNREKQLIDDAITIYKRKYPNIIIDYFDPFKDLDYDVKF